MLQTASRTEAQMLTVVPSKELGVVLQDTPTAEVVFARELISTKRVVLAKLWQRRPEHRLQQTNAHGH
jgi:hypothetical protein